MGGSDKITLGKTAKIIRLRANAVTLGGAGEGTFILAKELTFAVAAEVTIGGAAETTGPSLAGMTEKRFHILIVILFYFYLCKILEILDMQANLFSQYQGHRRHPKSTLMSYHNRKYNYKTLLTL